MKYGLIGERLGHSFSKEIHEQIGGYEYELVELNEQEFHKFMESKNFKAINVTIPYKEKVIPYLTHISKEASEIKAVNTIVNKNGVLYGYNTDCLGLKEMINHFNIDVFNKKVMILGTGGTSKTSHQVVKDLKAKDVMFVSLKKEDNTITYNQVDDYAKDIEVLFNTTPCEMYPNNDKEIISLDKFSSLTGVVDVVYNPLRANLILKAKNKSINCCSGLFMLIAQAFYAIEIFLDKKLDKQIIADLYQKMINEKENIVLIGMPSCGKSTIGKKLAKKINKTFVDVDSEIEKIIKTDIASFINQYGEEAFRKIESEVIEQLSKQNNLVIATGGGSILKERNVNFLKQNGRLYFLDRSLKNLCVTSSRPLSSTYDALEKRYKERYPIYNKVCDVKVNGDMGISTIIKYIIQEKKL